MKRSNIKPKIPDPIEAQSKAEMRIGRTQLRRLLDSTNVFKTGRIGRARIRSKKCQYKGIKFDSLWERDVYLVLEQRQKDGTIRDLDTHIVINFEIKNESGKALKWSINVDFTYFDIALNRPVRADAKPPKKLDKVKEAWFQRWHLLKLVQPDFEYVLYRPFGWRDIDL